MNFLTGFCPGVWSCEVARSTFKNGEPPQRENFSFATEIPRRPGWTAFDIAVEGEGASRSLVVYVEGREGVRQPIENFQVENIRFSEDAYIDGFGRPPRHPVL